MGSDVEIRRPRFAADWAELHALLRAHATELNRTPREVLALSRDLEGSDAEVWIAYTPRNGVVGFVALHLGRKKSDRHTASLRILLAQEARDSGIGGRLILRALDWADDNGIRRVTASPYLKQGQHSSIFERYGFVKEGVMRAAARKSDELLDVALLARVT